MSINAKQIDEFILHIEQTTECSALKEIVDRYVKILTDIIKEKLKENGELLKKYAPPIKPPSPDPFSIVSWVKKFIAGILTPQIEAAVKMALQMVELAAALTRLSTAIKAVSPRLEACRIDAKNDALVNSLGGIINEITGGLTQTLQDINAAQNELADLLGEPLSARFDTSSLSGFAKDAAENLNKIQNQVKVFIDTPIPPQEVFSGTVEVAEGVSLVIINGSVINVSV
jgi:hypothetical protein